MKHLLIILISILLLSSLLISCKKNSSSPLFGDNHKGETLYRWDTSSGYVWKEFREKDTNPKYKGDVENGEPNGLGIIINTNKGIGEFRENKPWNLTEYDKYGNIIGKWVNGVRQ